MSYHTPKRYVPLNSSQRKCGKMLQNVAKNQTELSDRQLLALPYLTASRTFTEAAENAGVSRETVRRWMNDPAFRQEYERQRDEAFALAAAEIKALMLKAAVVFAERLESDDPEERARASRDVMTYGAKVVDIKLKTSDAEENRKIADRLKRIMAEMDEEEEMRNHPPSRSPRTRRPPRIRRP